MPEIKHNFTGGKMEKDLDERLIPNGQYRDAMNIQVSTSEGSDVGTVQNILGNSIVPGQEFIGDGAYCVGSIADEKNDKLYYLVTESKELISNGNLDFDADGWTLGEGWGWFGGKIKGTNVSTNEKINQSLPLNVFIEDLYYEIKFTISGYYAGKIALEVTNEDGVRLAIASDLITGNGNYTFIRKMGSFTPTTTSGFFSRFWIQAVGGTDFVGRIDNISIKRASSYIVEYDSKTNSITPVIVDAIGGVLQFSSDRLITGINIIDDMLLWTDNYSEPKKINIPRCIQGTDPFGTTHTKFINEAQGKTVDSTYSGIDIREEHITVIKKSPQNAPVIELVSERLSDSTYSGVMRVTSGLVEGDSSLRTWTDAYYPWTVAPLGGPNNFSDFHVGKRFYCEIETDLDGNSGFTLDWQRGDTVVFKEFEDGEPPQVPITDYTIKAKILPSTVSGIYSASDAISEMVPSPNLEIPSSTGTYPVGIGWSSTDIDYNSITSSIDYSIPSSSAAWEKVIGTPTQSWDSATSPNGGSYKATISVSGNTYGTLNFIIIDNDYTLGNGISKPRYWATPGFSGNGTHEYTLTLNDDTGSYTSNFSYAMGKWFLQVAPGGFDGSVDSISIEYLDASNAIFALEVLDISGFPGKAIPPATELKYAVDKLDEEEKLFEFKFPRFAYRYQYQDKEYSNISPFSPIAFLPGSFDYHPRKGYNLGMTNRLDKIKIRDFVKNVPDGVSAIDILYKEETSPNIYVVDTIKPKHSPLDTGGNIWDENVYIVSSELVKQALPSNQILRPWDAVPRKALAQDISGNRVIYGNYVQNYDLKFNEEDYYPDFDFTITSSSNSLNTVKSIKSLREYQLGVVFVDEYGRETPVITNTSGVSNVTKLQSNKENKASVSFNNEKFPWNMKYFKFFIKETSGEYYNMAMDRWYDAGDSHVWLSFPSSDRNKVDIDTFLILKKGLESNDLIEDAARYKVLAIENEAPDFIKTKKVLIDKKTHDLSSASVTRDIFGNDVVNAPLTGRDTFKMKYRPFHDSPSSEIHKIKDGDLYVEFGTTLSDYVSNRYKIVSITTDIDPNDYWGTLDVANYSFQLDKFLDDDVDNIVNDVFNPSYIIDTATVKIYKYTVENSPKFDGRFFVKVVRDDTFTNNISVNDTRVPEYRSVASRKLYYMSSNHYNLHHENLTGLSKGVYGYSAGQWTTSLTHIGSGSAVGENWNDNSGTFQWEDGSGTNNWQECHFGKFAPFFRNYKYKNDEFKMRDGDGGDSPTGAGADTQGNWEHAGRYAFGDVDLANGGDYANQPWKFELAYFTARTDYRVKHRVSTVSTDDWIYDYYSGPTTVDSLKKADDHGWSESEREGKFNSDGEQTHGAVWFIDGGPYVGWRTGSNTLHWPWIGQPHDPASPGFASGVSAGGINIAVNAYDGEVCYQGNNSISEFFNIGKEGGNDNYDNTKTRNLVSKFYPGKQWRWKEDPSREVFTFQIGSYNQRLLRYDHDHTPYMVEGASTSEFLGDYLDFGTPDPNQPNYAKYDRKQFDAIGQLSPNFTKSWIQKWKNESGGTSMAWNPTNNGTTGPIPNGLHLSINHSVTPHTFNTGGDNYVIVDTLEAVCANHGAIYSIAPGMIMTSHSDADGGGTFTGSNGMEYLIISKITGTGPYNVYLTGYTILLSNTTLPVISVPSHVIYSDRPQAGQAMVFQQPAMNGYSQYSVNRINQEDPTNMGWDIDNPGILAVGYTMEFVEQIFKEPEMPDNPAIWETEPKESADLAIYYEASGLNPLRIDEENKNLVIPYGSTVHHIDNNSSIELGSHVEAIEHHGDDTATGLVGDYGWYIQIKPVNVGLEPLVGAPYITTGDKLKITKPDGSIITVTVIGYFGASGNRTETIYISDNLYGSDTEYTLNWHNCYAFGNGVESNRIRDNFNLPFILNGVKASTTLEEGYNEEHRKYGLIYSGIYNGDAGVNNLNQFIMAERITKEVNPIYGSIQKLHSRDSDLVALCEDKILRILANKDALYNADGNMQLTATQNVLGQTIPFIGEFGISTNPESFASEDYRAYFTDRVRGAVMRLSKDGLTPISNHGMKDWFRDNLSLGITNLLGEGNLSSADKWDIPTDGNVIINSGEAIFGGYNTDIQDSLYGRKGELRKNNILEIGKKYRLQYDVIEHSGLVRESDGFSSHLVINNSFASGGWIPAGNVVTSRIDGAHINVSWVANEADFILMQYQVNQGYPGPGYYDGVPNSQTTTVRDWVNAARITDGAPDTNNNGIPDNNDYGNSDWLYGGIVGIKNLVLEEIKEEPELIGSYDDRQDEYNLTIRATTSTTVSFKEDVKGWVSFKSFVPENAISCTNDYYTIKDGNLWQHHSVSNSRNTFYDDGFVNSSINVILNDVPGSMKSYYTLDYEGSQSRVIQNLDDNEYYNLEDKDGWFVSGIETNKQEGNIHEFIEKEGKWFNYIKGIDSDITSETDFGAFNIQGIGILSSKNSDVLTFSSSINTSLQIGDIIYFQTPTTSSLFDTIDSNNITKYGDVTVITNDTITVNLVGSAPVADDYIMFAKNQAINTSSLLGYYADVKFENNSRTKAELFSVGSEISESSK
jgi:hypothetical protein